MTITHATTRTAADEADVERAMSFADAALGVAGHEVTDPTLRELSRNVARGELGGDEAVKRAVAHIDAR